MEVGESCEHMVLVQLDMHIGKNKPDLHLIPHTKVTENESTLK